MPATTETDSAPLIDKIVARAVCYVEGAYPCPKSYATRVVLQFGIHSNFAEVTVPLAELDTLVPGVSGVSTSPVEKIRDGDLAEVWVQLDGSENSDDSNLLILSGTVREFHRDLGLDRAIFKVVDHRYFLEGVSIVGSWWANIDVLRGIGNTVAYRQGSKIHLNPNNQPNCIWANFGGVDRPFFCTPMFGITDNIQSASGDTSFIRMIVPEPSEHSTTQACYWTPDTFLLYVGWHATEEAKAEAQSQSNDAFPEYSIIPPDIIEWPDSLCTFLFDRSQQSRKAFERIYHCHNLLSILDDLCKAAGPYAPYVVSKEGGINTATICRTRYLGQDGTQSFFGNSVSNTAIKGIRLSRLVHESADNLPTSRPTVVGGHISESSENTFHVFSAVGDHHLIECRCASALDAATDPDGYVPLKWNFSAANLETARAQIEAQLNADEALTDILPAVFRRFPDLCCSWIVKPGFDFQVDTAQDGMPVAVVNRTPMPHLLSSYIPSFASDEFARTNSRYPIPVEVTKESDDSDWQILTSADSLSIFGDGSINFTQLRDQDAENGVTDGLLYTITQEGESPNIVVTLVPKRIRVTLAIPCDHRLTQTVSLPGTDAVLLPAQTDTDDSDRMNLEHGVRTLAIDTGMLLASEERSLAFAPYPVPQSLNLIAAGESSGPYPAAGSTEGASIFGDAVVLRNDGQYALNQANRKAREFGRLDRKSELFDDQIDVMAQPGDFVDAIDNSDGTDFPIKAVRKTVIHEFTESPNQSTRSQYV